MNRLLSLAIIVAASVAHAAPPTDHPIDPEMGAWYRSLKQPNTGFGCCSVADCRPYDARINADHYEIYLHDHWLAVPNEVVLHRDNRAGNAVACLRQQWNYDYAPPPPGFSPEVLCFVPGPET